MANKQAVIDAHRKHPDWSDTQIAKNLDCMPEYVRTTAKRNGFTLPSRMDSYRRGWEDAIKAAVEKASMLSRNAEKPRHKMIAAQVAEFISTLREAPCLTKQ